MAEAVNNGFNLKLPYENITGSELAEMDFFRNPLLRKSSKGCTFKVGECVSDAFQDIKQKLKIFAPPSHKLRGDFSELCY